MCLRARSALRQVTKYPYNREIYAEDDDEEERMEKPTTFLLEMKIVFKSK